MNSLLRSSFVLAVAGMLPAGLFAAAADIQPPQKRVQTIEKAARLTRPAVPAPTPADLVPMFNPVDFEQPDPEEQKANAAAGIAPAGAAAPAQPAGPMGDRELLATIAARILPTGSIVRGSKAVLTFPGKTVGIGQSFVVNYNGQDYELEVVGIERTTFTLRLRGEEITRPIQPTK